MVKLTPNLNPRMGWNKFSKDGVRDSYRQVLQTLEGLSLESLNKKHSLASDIFMNQGITFTAVYSDEDQGIERIFPFDIIPRILTKNGTK
jgi:uncharacterized circularly permuted ATP-grasp superfamily protein